MPESLPFGKDRATLPEIPVFVILDKNGNRIHTQNSAYLEEGKGHSPKKVLEFLKHWSPASIDPKSYKK